MNLKLISEKFDSLHCCVIIPTFNNQKTLRNILEEVLEYTKNIIVVNDGSTDKTPQILQDFSNIIQIHFDQNRGKGAALAAGFQKAINLGYKFAISIDSDGQHFPKDLPRFVDFLGKSDTKNLLLIGSRNMTQEGVPRKSSFGNKFSNFWFWVETGIRLDDTQSGFRLYPLETIKKLNLYTRKFEFEIEVIVKSAWKGVKVKNIPIQVHYDLEDRVTHFRPFRDFTRISILNTWLVFLTFFYIKPLHLYQKIKKKGIRRFLMEDFLGSDDSPEKKALSISLGVLVGLSPLWGFHTVIVIFLAILLKLNKVIAIAFSNVSLPPFIPFIIFSGLKIGSWILGEEFVLSFTEVDPSLELVKYLKTYVVGSVVLAVCGAVISGVLGYLFLVIFQRKKILKNG